MTLSARGLRKRFGGVLAVDDVSIELSGSSIVGLVGPNGAGKTTVFNLLSGLARPDAGEVHLDARDVTTCKPWELARLGIQRTYQQIRLFRTLSALDNVAMGAVRSRPEGLRLNEARALAHELLDKVGFIGPRDRSPTELPYAFQRVVELARALAAAPKVLLLDEPAAGMHGSERRALAGLIRGLRDDGLAIALVEHDIGLVSRTCDVVTVLDFGRVIATGTPSKIREDPAVVEAYLGTSTAGPHS